MDQEDAARRGRATTVEFFPAVRAADSTRVRVTRLPSLAAAADRSGKGLAEHAAECGDEEIARLFAASGGVGRSAGEEGD